MLKKLKQRLYFLVASYFRFCAGIQLKKWHPKVIVITGSSGKTTTMHLVQSQLGESARYSHHANSAFGICFDILGLSRETLQKSEWIKLFLLAPYRAFKQPYKEALYVAEVDCDRPREGAFLAKLLRPAGTIWLSSTQTHSVNFQSVVSSGKFTTVDEAIAYEFGHLTAQATDFVIVNSDNSQITAQLPRSNAKIYQLSMDECSQYTVSGEGTTMKTPHAVYTLASLVPKEIFYSLQACELLTAELQIPFDPLFKTFRLPPGRSSLFSGIKDTTIIDSSYNSSSDALKAMIELFVLFKAKSKWLVVGDILEQGEQEATVHTQVAHDILKGDFERIILVGPRVKKYTAPELKKLGARESSLTVFLNPKDALIYLQDELRGSEIIMFKGARFLEGIIEHLLIDSADVAKLCRRELIWQNRRKQWGL